MSTKRFKVDARAVISLGRDSIKDHVTAVVELVKNSYDAGAKVVEVELSVKDPNATKHKIRIADNGTGMADSDVEKKWLRIGYSEKLTRKKVGGRRQLGEKGVGRLSADRLGEFLQLQAQTDAQPPVGIKVNWADFETSGVDLDQVEITVLDTVEFEVPRPSKWNEKDKAFGKRPASVKNSRTNHGCELVITGLRQSWIADDIQRLRDELSQLVNPFDQLGDFQIRIITDLDPDLSGVLSSPKIMDGEIEGIFCLDDGQVRITQQSRADKRRKVKRRPQIVPFNEFMGLTVKKADVPLDAEIGPVEVRIRLYSLGEGFISEATKSLVAGFLTQNAGVRVYRDGVRVVPYGDPEKPEGDWLELAQRKAGGRAAVTRKDWRIEANRIVAAVQISRDANPELRDAAGREGLIANEAFNLLRLFVTNCVRHLELAYHRLRDAPIAAKEAIMQPRKVVRYFKKYAEELNKDLKVLAKSLPKSQKQELEKVRETIKKQEKKSAELGASLTEIMDQALTYRGLATLGIAHASFAHEIQMSAGQFVEAAYAASYELDPPPNIKKAKGELAKAIKHGERISTWGSYSLTRVKAAKRKAAGEEPISDMLAKLISDLAPFFEGSSVKLKEGRIDDVNDRVVPMDFESMVINLLTNAYDFVKDSPTSPREVVVGLRKKSRDGAAGYELTVGDSGPGVPKHIREDIWRPLFTTKKTKDNKPSGTGLGLAIVDNIVKEFGGNREVGSDPKLGGALFTIWIPNHSTP